MRLPSDFDSRGVLPPGDYEATLNDLRRSLLVSGPSTTVPGWDAHWRLGLTHQAEKLIRQLWQVGIQEIFLDGSFAEAKPHPNDIDGYFSCDVQYFASGQLERDLNALDPHAIWTWDPAARLPYRGYAKKQLPMWHVYRVELYPHYSQLSGIVDQNGHAMMFPAAFRRQRRRVLSG